MEEEIRQHLEGFEERRRNEQRRQEQDADFKDRTEKYHRENTARLDDTTKRINENTKRIESILAQGRRIEAHLNTHDQVLEEIGTNFNAHYKLDESFQKTTEKAIQQFADLAPVIREQLIPAHEREQKKEIAMAWLKDNAKTWQFWATAFMSLGGFGYAIIGLISKLSGRS